MKKISLFGLVLLFVSQFSLAGPVKITYDFWHSAPHVYDGHLILDGETDATGNVIAVFDGTLDLAGAVFDFNTTSFGFRDVTESWNTDWIFLNVFGTYVNENIVSNEVWARYEGRRHVYESGDTSFVDLNTNSWDDLLYPGARISIVDVPEPAPILLLALGLFGLFINRNLKTK